MTKSDMIGVRIPSDLLMKLDKLKDEEGIDRSALILRALRYWVSVNGKISTDAEYLNSIKKIEENVEIIQTDISDIKNLREQVSEQQKVIATLVKMLP